MLAEAPLNTRPTWNADTIVRPKADEDGSTSVLWALKVLVYGSVLSSLGDWWDRAAAVAGGRAIAVSSDSPAAAAPSSGIPFHVTTGLVNRERIGDTGSHLPFLL